MKKYLALFAAFAMVLALVAGCSLTEGGTPSATDDASGATPSPIVDASELDLEAVVATVGSETITLGEVKETFDYYVEYFAMYGYDLTSDPDTLAMVLDDVVDDLVRNLLIEVKGTELGYDAFDTDQQSELETRIQSELDSLDAYYRAQAETEAASDSTIDVEARVMELIMEEAVYNLDDDNATYEQYLAFLEEGVTSSYIAELMQDDKLKDVAVGEEALQSEYDTLLAEQAVTYSESPAAYKLDSENYEMYGSSPVVYVPEGYSRILHILVAYEGELSDSYAANEADMEIIKSEYSELAFADALADDDENADRMEELVEQYQQLVAENEALYADYISSAAQKATSLYAELEGGADFATLAKEQSDPTEYSDYLTFAEKGILISNVHESEADWSDEVKAQFARLSLGEYSEVFSDDEGFHIIYYLADETAGDVPLESVREGILGYLLEETRESEWNAIVESWMNDGSVTLNEDVYKSLIAS